MSRRCAKTTGRYWRSQGGKRKPELTGIVEVYHQQWQCDELSLAQPGGSRVREREGKQRGSVGLLIGVGV
jgi:hypothetical protein